jgi:hypothetical protein
MAMKNMHIIDKVMTPMKSFGINTGFNRVLLLIMLALPLKTLAAEDQQTFSKPEDAVSALVLALKTDDTSALISIFGDKYKNLIITDDQANDRAVHAESADKIAAFHSLAEQGENRRVLLIGYEAWPLPIPLVREGSAWRFASEEGADEMLNRRIGGNENNAIDVLSAYLQAQREYASVDRDNDGVLQYAQKLASSSGKKDGLYWPVDETKGEELSPFGPLIAESSPYLAGHKKGDPYRGYHFKILTGQGKNAPGGKYSYIINKRMIAGYAMVAYPSQYGETGVMTFIINHNGIIYEKNLGKNSKSIGEKMLSFNPDKSWKEVIR